MKERAAGRWRAMLQDPRLPYLTLFCVMLAFHLAVMYQPGDEAFYGSIMKDLSDWPSLWRMLQTHYRTWSARLLVETLFCIFSMLPPLAWRLVTPVLITAGVWVLAYGLRLEQRANAGWLLCVLTYLYQWWYLAEAGWIVTSIAYGWALMLSLLGLYPVFMLLRGAQPRLRHWLPCTVCLAFGANMEQTALFLCFFYGACAVWLWLQRRSSRPQAVSPGLLLQWALVAGLLVFALTAPGNAARAEEDVFKFYLNYPMQQWLERIESGISTAIAGNVYGGSRVFCLFALLSALAVWERRCPLPARLLAPLPALLLLPLSIFRYDVVSVFPQISLLTDAYQGTRYITLANFGQPIAYLPLLVGYGILALCVLNILAAFGFGGDSALCVGLLALGGMSHAAIAFTPSIAASGGRVGIFFSFCIIAVCGVILRALGGSAPEGSAPGEPAPERSTPGQSVLGEPAPGQPAPERSTLGQSVPGEPAPGQPAPPQPALRRKGCRLVFFAACALLCCIQAVSLIEMC